MRSVRNVSTRPVREVSDMPDTNEEIRKWEIRSGKTPNLVHAKAISCTSTKANAQTEAMSQVSDHGCETKQIGR